MPASMINIHAAKTQLSQLIKRAERGEHITIARDGKPVAQLGPAPRARRAALPPDDPLLNLDKFAIVGDSTLVNDKLNNDEIDHLLYGKP